MSCEWCGAFDEQIRTGSYDCDKCRLSDNERKYGMRDDFIYIGSAPYDEECAQVGRDSVAVLRGEATIYKRQLERMFPDGDFRVKAEHHDFGSYYEVVAYFGDENDPAYRAAFEAEANGPAEWDAEALSELAA